MLPINFTKKGSGDDLVLLHGFCENSNMWLNFQSELSKNYTVYSLDLPGFGESKPMADSFSLKEVADVLINWTKEVGISKACWIGHSLGGYVALEVLNKAPELVSGLGLFHSSAFADSDENKTKRDKALAFLAKHPIEKFIRPFIPSLFHANRLDELQNEIDTAMAIGLKTSKEAAMGYTAAMRSRADHFNTWANTNIPLLYIGGVADSRIPLQIAEEHIEAGHHVDGYMLSNAGHMGMYEDPSHCLQIINDYLLKVY